MNYKEYMEDFSKNAIKIIDKTVKEIKDFSKKVHNDTFVIGLSGGIDCAVAMSLCLKAGMKVIALTMPYEKDQSKQRAVGANDAFDQAKVLNVEIQEIDITKTVNSLLENFKDNKLLENKDLLLAKANILPRIRMTNLYYLAQGIGALVLGTSNLSEYTMGYFTKWGDMGCDYNPIKKFTKSEIYILAKHLDIIESIQNKAPSADLWDGQTDENEMHLTYYEIDKYIRNKDESSDEVKEKVERAKARSMHKKFKLVEE